MRVYVFEMIARVLVSSVVIRYVAPTICGGSLLKGEQYKRRGLKNIHNKAIQTKIHLYINKYIVKKISRMFKIKFVKYSCVRVCMCESGYYYPRVSK